MPRTLILQQYIFDRSSSILNTLTPGVHLYSQISIARPFRKTSRKRGIRKTMMPHGNENPELLDHWLSISRRGPSGFDDALCVRLNGEFDIIAETTADQGRAGNRAFTAKRMEWRRLGTTSFECESGGLDAVSWVEVASRVSRVKIFVVPARDIPRGQAVREIESVAQPVGKGDSQGER